MGAPARVRANAVDSPPAGFAGDYQEARALEALKTISGGVAKAN